MSKRRLKSSEVVEALIESLPDPPGLPPREFSLADRHAVRSHVQAKLGGAEP